MPRSTAELITAFETGTLEPAEFSHEDHVTVAHGMLVKQDFLNAARNYLDGLKALTEKAGVPHKVNTTITLALLSVISERMLANPGETTEDFLEGNADLLTGNPLAGWYSPERLNSEAARTGFLMPDHAPKIAAR